MTVIFHPSLGDLPSPLVVALVLGPSMEKSLRQALFMARGDVRELAARPLTSALLIAAVVALLVPAVMAVFRGVPR